MRRLVMSIDDHFYLVLLMGDVVFPKRAAPAQQFAVLFDIAAILDPVATGCTLDAFERTSRHVLFGDGDAHFLNVEKFVLGHDPVGIELPRVFVLDLQAIFF